MRIATYNVRVDTDVDVDWSWNDRKSGLISLIDYHDWDLLTVQEVKPNQVQDLKQLTEYQILSKEREGDGTGEGLALLFKPKMFDCLDHGAFWLSETPDRPSIHPNAAFKRVCLWAVLKNKASGQQFMVINVHLDNESEEARYQGMQLMLKELAPKIVEYNTIIMGDFNAELDESVHELLSDFANARFLADIKHYGPNGTFEDFNYDIDWQNLENIDYIYTKGFIVDKTAVITDSLDRKFVSDHFPVEAVLHAQ